MALSFKSCACSGRMAGTATAQLASLSSSMRDLNLTAGGLDLTAPAPFSGPVGVDPEREHSPRSPVPAPPIPRAPVRTRVSPVRSPPRVPVGVAERERVSPPVRASVVRMQPRLACSVTCLLFSDLPCSPDMTRSAYALCQHLLSLCDGGASGHDNRDVNCCRVERGEQGSLVD
jgi:hypothetical protein